MGHSFIGPSCASERKPWAGTAQFYHSHTEASNNVRRGRGRSRNRRLLPVQGGQATRLVLQLPLSVVKGCNQAAPGRRGEGGSGLSDLGYFQGEAVSLNCLVELVQEALRFGRASAENDRYRLVDLRHTLSLCQRSPQVLDQVLNHLVIINMKSALIFVLGSCGEIQAFLLYDSNPGRQLAGDGGNAAGKICSGLAR